MAGHGPVGRSRRCRCGRRRLAHALGIETVAEGVETEEQRCALVTIGSEQAQGYLWARPLRSEEFADWLVAKVAAAGDDGF